MKRLLFLSLAFVAVSSAQTKPIWKHVGLNGGGSMYSIAGSPHDPKVMMVSSDMGGAFVSRDGGRNWRMIHHRYVRGNTQCKPFFDRDTPGIVYFPKSNEDRDLMVSIDNGAHWEALVPAAEAPWKKTISFIYARKKTLLVASGNLMYVSLNRSETWRQSKGITGKVLGACSDADAPSQVHYIGTDAGVFKSVDGGRTFVAVSGKLPGKTLTAFAGGSSKLETILYAAVPCSVVNGKLAGGVFRSTDEGRSWQKVMNDHINVQIRRSSRWANGDLPQYRDLMVTDRLPRRVYVYCSGTSYYPPNHSTIYRSNDAGNSWFSILFSDPRFKGSYNVEDDRLTVGLGQRYQYPPLSVSVNPGNANVLMMSTDMMVFATFDGGRRWQVAQSKSSKVFGMFGKHRAWPGTGLGVTSTWNYDIDPFDPKRHYICYTDVGFARSLDAGQTWIWDGPRLPWKNTVYEIAFDPGVKGKLWGAFSETHDIPNYNIIGKSHRVNQKGGVAVSLDHGENWKPLSLPQAPCVSVVLDKKSTPGQRTLYATLFEKGVWKSTNDGRSWMERNDGLGTEKNRRACRLVLHDDGTLFCLVTARRISEGEYDGKGPGIYRSIDGAKTWKKITPTLHWPKDFSVNPASSNDIVLGAATVRGHPESGLYRTKDGGKHWKLIISKELEHFGAYFHPTRPNWIYMTCTEGAKQCGLFLSTDDGNSWTPFTTLPFSNIQRVHFDPKSPDEIILSTFGASVLRGPAKPQKF